MRTDDTFCCLGVACDLSGLGEWEDSRYGCAGAGYAGYDEESGRWKAHTGLPFPVRERLSIAPDGETVLAEMNDFDDKTFKEIAKWIRENVDRVFTQGDAK